MATAVQPHPEPPRPRLAAALALFGVVAWLGPTPIWWLGLGSLGAAWVLGGDALAAWLRRVTRPLVERRWGMRSPLHTLFDLAAVAVVVVVAWTMLRAAANGHRPISHDHPVHYFKAWQLRYELLPEGRLFGWSHRMFAGYPVNYLYPIGADLWVSAVHLLSLGLLTFSQAYGVALFLFHALSGYAVYRFGERLIGRLPGLIGALLFLTDQGAFRYGGWAYTIEYGVWPQTLSLAFALLALARLPVLCGLDGGRAGGPARWRAVAAFGVLMGLALLSHPMPLLLFPPVLVLTVLVLVLHRPEGAGLGAALWRLTSAHLIGALVAAAWLLPFFSVSHLAGKYGVFWKSTFQLGSGLYELDVLEGSWPLVLPAAVLGVAVLLRRQEERGQIVAWSILALLAMGCSSIIDELHLASLTAAVAHVQFQRLSILIKPLAFIAAGFAAVWVCGQLRAAGEAALQRGGRLSRGRRAIAAGLIALTVGPIAVSFSVDYYTRRVDKKVPTTATRSDRGERAELVAFLGERPRRGPLDRVAFVGGHHEHDLVDLATEVEQPVFKSGFTPCSNFLFKPESASPELLEALHVGTVVARRDLTGAEYQLLDRFGAFRVYDFTRFRPEPFTITDGVGPVELVRFEDEEVVLSAGAGASGTLRLDVSAFPRWRVTRDGEPVAVEVTPHPADAEHTGFMSVPLEPGQYRFVFEADWRERAGPVLALLGLLLALLLTLGGSGAPGLGALARSLEAGAVWSDRLVAPRQRWIAGAAAGGLGLGLLVAVGLALWTPAMTWEGEGRAPDVDGVRYDFLESLADAEVEILAGAASEVCPWRLDRFVCRPRDWFHVTSRPERIEGYSTRRCISAHALDEGPLRVAFPRVPLGDAIVGYYGVAESGKKGKNRRVDLDVRVDGELLLAGRSRRDAVTHWFQAPLSQLEAVDADGDGEVAVSFTVSAERTGFRQLCFYAQMVDLADD